MNNLTTATTPLSAEESAYIAWTKSMIKTYLYYASLIVTPIGLSLNVLLILVFARKRFARETMGFYYIVSASAFSWFRREKLCQVALK